MAMVGIVWAGGGGAAQSNVRGQKKEATIILKSHFCDLQLIHLATNQQDSHVDPTCLSSLKCALDFDHIFCCNIGIMRDIYNQHCDGQYCYLCMLCHPYSVMCDTLAMRNLGR